MAQLVDLREKREHALEAAWPVLARGEPVAIPTETVYGLAADATDAQALARVFKIKRRPRFNPLICHIRDIEMADEHGLFDPLSRALAEAFLPGPLTLVLPRRDGSAIDPAATAGLDTVGLRVPVGFARQLVSAYGKPLAAPSANTSGR